MSCTEGILLRVLLIDLSIGCSEQILTKFELLDGGVLLVVLGNILHELVINLLHQSSG